jgi:hypothetical protein
MSIIEKIISKTKPEPKMGPGDLANKKLQEQLAQLRAEGAERGRLAALEATLAADDLAHYADHRAAFVRREKPCPTALEIYDANQSIELLQRVIARTKPQQVKLNDGSFGPHPTIVKLVVAKGALVRAIAKHERVTSLRPGDFEGLNRIGSTVEIKGTK